MEGSRTPLAKWRACMECLASTNGINAVQLAKAIGVTHKVAWTMLRNLRRVISLINQNQKLQGIVHAGMRCLGPYFLFVPYRRYNREHVVLISASMDPATGKPETIKLRNVKDRYLDGKCLTKEGERRFLSEDVHPESRHKTTLLSSYKMFGSPLRHYFEEAKGWLNRLFHGLGEKYLQHYLDEYSFRWNASSRQLSLRDEWYKVCLYATRSCNVSGKP